MSTLAQHCSPLETVTRRSTIGGLVFELVSEIDEILTFARPGESEVMDTLSAVRNRRDTEH